MNFSIIGTNFISDSFVDAIGKIPDARVAAVYSRARERGEEFAAKHSIPRVYCSLEEMLADGSIDAVYIASPNICHAEQAIAALNAGKHVLCEKIIAHSHGAYLEMARAAKESGRVLLEAMRPDFDPALDLIREGLKKIGKIRHASLEFCQYSSRYDKFKSGEVLNAFKPEMKNSALADIGVYPLHLAVRLFGEPREILSSSVKLSNGFEGAGAIILNYGDMLATVQYSKITDSVNPSVIVGEGGSLLIDKISAPTRLTLKLRGGAEEIIPYSPAENNMVYEILGFMEAVRGERSTEEYLKASEITTRIADKILG